MVLIHVFDHGVGSGLWSVKDDLEQDLEEQMFMLLMERK